MQRYYTKNVKISSFMITIVLDLFKYKFSLSEISKLKK